MKMFTSQALLDSVGNEVNVKSVNEAFKQYGIDWTVKQKKVYDPVVDVQNCMINYRSDNNGFLGIVSDSHYKIVNNIDAFNFVDELTDFTMEKVGQMNGGKRVFIVGKMNEKFEIAPNDYVQQYVSFIHGHTGKNAIQIIVSPIRMFCTNQLNLMLETSRFKYSIKHSGDVETKLYRVKQAFQMNSKYMLELGSKLRKLTTEKATESIDSFLDKLFPETSDNIRAIHRRERIIDSVKTLYRNKDDNQNYKGTQFGYLNAVADYVSHQKLKQRSSETNTIQFFKTVENNQLLDRAYQILKAA